MRRSTAILSVLVAVLVLSPDPLAAQEKKLRLFILSGQSNMAGLNPTLSFTPALKKAYPNDEVVVVKSAQGGQPIRRWYKDWKLPDGAKDKASAAKPGDLYDVLMAQVNKSMGTRKADSIAFVWMQGEADARQGFSSIYEASLRGLIKQLRDDLKHRDIAVVVGRLSDYRNGTKEWDAVRAAQERIAKEEPFGALVNTDDLNDKGGKNDLHYTKDGYVMFGDRCAQEAILLVQKIERK